MTSLKIGIIGGSGFYSMEEFEGKEELSVSTEFGSPSGPIVSGKIGNVPCVALARHGKGHKLNPTEVNYRANIRAFQKLGVTHILAATACGSLKEEMKPKDLCVLSSFVDRTTKRSQTFHDQSSPSNFGTVCHIPMADCFSEDIRQVVIKMGKELNLPIHEKATMVTIEGPRFSSKAESLLFKSWGCDVINMTTVPEVVLAAEAGIAYCSVAMVTDYDCWRESDDSVDVATVLAVLKDNIINVKNVFIRAIQYMENNWTDSQVKVAVDQNMLKAQNSVMN